MYQRIIPSRLHTPLRRFTRLDTSDVVCVDALSSARGSVEVPALSLAVAIAAHCLHGEESFVGGAVYVDRSRSIRRSVDSNLNVRSTLIVKAEACQRAFLSCGDSASVAITDIFDPHRARPACDEPKCVRHSSSKDCIHASHPKSFSSASSPLTPQQSTAARVASLIDGFRSITVVDYT